MGVTRDILTCAIGEKRVKKHRGYFIHAQRSKGQRNQIHKLGLVSNKIYNLKIKKINNSNLVISFNYR